MKKLTKEEMARASYDMFDEACLLTAQHKHPHEFVLRMRNSDTGEIAALKVTVDHLRQEATQ